MKILTVCLGNICRSPAAESVLQAKLRAAGIEAHVASAGTADYHIGKGPHHLTQEVGTELGYEFTSVADQLTAQHLDEFDVVLVMDESNLANALAVAETDEQKAKIIRMGAFATELVDALIAQRGTAGREPAGNHATGGEPAGDELDGGELARGELGRNELGSGENQQAKTENLAEIASVPDPYGYPREAFEAMYVQLEDAADGFVKAVQSGHLGQVLQHYAGQ